MLISLSPLKALSCTLVFFFPPFSHWYTICVSFLLLIPFHSLYTHMHFSPSFPFISPSTYCLLHSHLHLYFTFLITPYSVFVSYPPDSIFACLPLSFLSSEYEPMPVTSCQVSQNVLKTKNKKQMQPKKKKKNLPWDGNSFTFQISAVLFTQIFTLTHPTQYLRGNLVSCHE